MDLKETYLHRKDVFTSSRKSYQQRLEYFATKKKEILDEFMSRAKAEAEHCFEEEYGEDFQNTKNNLAHAETELALLRCPEERCHHKSEGQYYHCKLCNFVWDDTSPAHF